MSEKESAVKNTKEWIYDIPIMSLQKSNSGIINLIKNKKKFMICKMSEDTGGLAISTAANQLPQGIALHEIISFVDTKSGIYSKNPVDYKDYGKLYFDILKKSAAVAYGPPNISQLRTFTELNFFNMFRNIPAIHHEVLEPYYAIMDDIIPWSHKLMGKKVLIIHPFVESFKKQLNAGFTIYKNNPIFMEDQEFIFYKPYNTSGKNHLHKNWKQTFEIMCSEISKLDFDIALLGCGGYGVPLCGFIYDKLNKSAIYIGGGLQLLFGVMGKRWDNTEMWQNIINENDCEFIRPSEEETIKNKDLVSDGCYW
jgi:hypothetical protein